jgi:tRNA modification GTPase
LDFSEEDVEFADRKDLKDLVNAIQKVIGLLISSFEVGNVIKNGLPVAVIGKPNAGKSTLLNTLLNEERAIVSHIPGTTRDVIEDELNIEGVLFRIIDTAGIRKTNDTIEAMGVEKTYEQIKKSSIAMYVFDVNETSADELKEIIIELQPHLNKSQLLLLANKIDADNIESIKEKFKSIDEITYISAKEKTNIDGLKAELINVFENKNINPNDTIVTNSRHIEALSESNDALSRVLEGLNFNISGDLLAMDIRNSLYHLGTITGQVSTDDLLKNIFSRFCIGK